MAEKKLILTMGLPRSGKSTWAIQQGVPVVNPDSVRLTLTGQRYVKESEPMVWAVVKTMVRALFITGHETIILDATNVTKARRNEWLSNDWKVFVKVFPVQIHLSKQRAIRTDQKDLLPVIDRMVKDWEYPYELPTIQNLEDLNEYCR